MYNDALKNTGSDTTNDALCATLRVDADGGLVPRLSARLSRFIG